MLATLDGLIRIVEEKFDMVDEDRVSDKTMEHTPRKQRHASSGDVSPTSVITEPPSVDFSNKQSLLLPLRVRAVGKLNPVEVKRLKLQSFAAVDGTIVAEPVVSDERTKLAELQLHRIDRPTPKSPVSPGGERSAAATSPTLPQPVPVPPVVAAPPPSSPPPSLEQVDALPQPPPSERPDPPLPLPPQAGKGMAPPPPPPFGSGKPMLKRSDSKLKRSTQMGNLYRLLKGKVEGSSLNAADSRRKGQFVRSSGGKQGMADALKEMTKRSAYFQQIEEDVGKYGQQITELKASIISFRTKDMMELLNFHNKVESVLENLTDESQVKIEVMNRYN